MPSKKSKKNKQFSQSKKNRKELSTLHTDGRTSARLAIDDLLSNHAEASMSPDSRGQREKPNFGQAFDRSPRNGHFWHDPFDRYLFPPTALNFRPPFDADGSHLARKSPGLTEYEGKSVAVLGSMMAPGHDSQPRNQPPPPNRPHQQQMSNHQRTNMSPNGTMMNGEPQQHRNQQPKERDAERDQHQRRNPGFPAGGGPMPNHIQVAKPYVFQQAIEGCLKDVGVAQAREDNIRLAGVQWIDNVRRALKLPVRTFDTAVVYYHKFRLVHSDGEYSFVDAAAAALFAACKIEDTLKKSRDILCAAHNLKIPRSEHLSPDDPAFEHHSRSIIGLERLMLESSSFDFRNRHPQTLMIKLAKYYDLGSPKTSTITRTAYSISLDLYRTFAPLKQSTATLAFSCLELSIRLHDHTRSSNAGSQAVINGSGYTRWGISRAEVMETLLDLLELYTHYRTSTTVGPDFPIDTFLEVRIPLNEELNRRNLSRFTEYLDTGRSNADPASYAGSVNGISTPTTALNGTNTVSAPNSARSPTSPTVGTPTAGKSNGIRQKAGERGREGTVRFMLNPDRERQERLVVAEYYPQPPTSGVDASSAPPSEPDAQAQAQQRPSTPQQPPSQPAAQLQVQSQSQSHPPSQPHSHPNSHSHPHSQPHHGPARGNHNYGQSRGHGPGRRGHGYEGRHHPRPPPGQGRSHSGGGGGGGSGNGDIDGGGIGRPPRR